MAWARGTWGERTHWRPLCVPLHDSRRLHSPRTKLRDAWCLFRIPLGEYPIPHAGVVEHLSSRHPPVDQRARRAHQSVDMAASASDLPLFPQVRRERSRHVNSEAPPKLIFAGGPSILTFPFEPDEARCEMFGCDHRPM